ncbi:MAG: hypothetical protein IJT94_03655, partial [Oscillibacter sp.]|nr:hypothetical protein [Oscillibacter sp.]
MADLEKGRAVKLDLQRVLFPVSGSFLSLRAFLLSRFLSTAAGLLLLINTPVCGVFLHGFLQTPPVSPLQIFVHFGQQNCLFPGA